VWALFCVMGVIAVHSSSYVVSALVSPCVLLLSTAACDDQAKHLNSFYRTGIQVPLHALSGAWEPNLHAARVSRTSDWYCQHAHLAGVRVLANT